MLKSKKRFLFLKAPSNVGGTFIKKLKETIDLLEKWTEHNKIKKTKQNTTPHHGSFNKYCRPDFHIVIFRLLLLLRTSILGSNGTLLA